MASPTLNIGEDVDSNTFHTGTELHTAAINGDKLTIERILKGSIDTLNKGDKYGRTALVYTIVGDWYECAEILVALGASLLQVDSDKRNVLHWAAYLDRPKFIKLFLEHLGSNLEFNTGDKDGRTAFHYAARQPNSKCLRLLLKRLTLNKMNLNTTDNEKMTALHWSVFYNHLENFKLLLREGAETTKRDAKGRCLLHMAVLNPGPDSVRIVRILLKHNRHFSIQFDCERHTSLHLAVASGNQELVRELCLAEESALNCLDHLSRSVLHYAVLNNDIEIIDILLSAGVSPHHVDNTGASVLHYAAKNNNAQIVKRFLERFKNFEDTSDHQGRTALMWAASEGSYDVLNLMLKNLSHFNIHASDEKGMTALHVACCTGREECVKKLIANSADINQPDKLGQTALFKACAQGHHKIINILRDRKGSHSTMQTQLSSIQEESDTLRNSDWSHESMESGVNEIGGENKNTERAGLVPVNKGDFLGNTSESLKNRPTMKSRINEKHPRGNLTEFSSKRLPGIHELVDDNGCTPLHFAAHAGHTHVCSWLLSEGVNPGKKDSQGRTALHGAAFNGHTECIALMLSHNPRLVNDRDYDGYSLLHHAASNGQLETVKLLVSETFQACLNARLKSTDWTPLDFAMAADHQDVTQFLIDNGALTTAWLQDVAADKIKKFLRRVVVRKHDAKVKPLIERHKQLTKEEQLKHCESEVRNDDLISDNMIHEDVAHNNVNDVIRDDVNHDDIKRGDVTRDDVTHQDVMNNTDTINKRNCMAGGHKNDDVTEQQCTQETRENQTREKTDDVEHSTLRSEDRPLTTNHDQLRAMTENKNTIHSDQKSDKNQSATNANDLETFASMFGETEICDNGKHILLLDACYHGNVTSVQKLLQEKLDVNYRDDRGCTALHFAAAQGQDAICEYLLENGAETRMRDNNGRTALHQAAIAGNVSAVSLLLRHNQDLISYLDCDNRSALHYAASLGHLNAVRLLLDTRVQDICAKSTQLTALDYAILGQHDDVSEYMINQGVQPSGLLDQAARVIQTNFRKSLGRKGISVKSRRKPSKVTRNKNKSKDGEISGCVVINTGYSTSQKTKEILSSNQINSVYSTPKTDKKSRPTDRNPIKRFSEDFSEGITTNSEANYDYSKTANVSYSKYPQESRIKISSSARSKGTTLTFVESNVEKLSRAPESVIVASGEKERIFKLRDNWERIALLRRKKQAALIIQKHYRKYLVKKKAIDVNKGLKTDKEIKDNTKCAVKPLTQNGTSILGTENEKNGTYLPSKTLEIFNSPTKLSKNRTTNSDEAKESQTNLVSPNKVETSSGVYNNDPMSPRRLTRKTVVNRLLTTSPESSENEPLHEKRQYKSAFPLLSPKSSGTSSNRSPSNPDEIQLPNNRRPSHSNRRIEALISPKSSSTSSNQSPSNAGVNQLPSNRRASWSPSKRRADVAPVLSKNELVNLWLSDGMVSENSCSTKTTNKGKNTEVETSNSETRLRKDPSKSARRISSHSARIRRNSQIKNAYGSPAALSYNFALDTYHPLVSRRGRKEAAFPFRTSSRVRPNSMKRVEVGWVRTADLVSRSTPSES